MSIRNFDDAADSGDAAVVANVQDMHEASRWLADLCALGLTQYEAKAYLALIHRRTYTAAEVARASSVPRQRIYDVLTSLFERGLVRTRKGASVQYTAIDPKLAMDRLMAERRSALQGLERITTDLIEALAPTWSDGQAETDPLDFVEVLRDPHMLTERFGDIQRGAQRQLLVMAKLPHLVVENPDGLAATARLRASGGDVRCIYEEAVLDDPGAIVDIERFVEAGEDARVIANVPMRLCIVDETRALMSLRDPVAGSASSTNMLVEHAELAQCLGFAFETLWTRARPIAQARAARS